MSATQAVQSDTTSVAVPGEPSIADIVKVLQILAVKVDQRLASQAGLAAVLALMPGAALVNPAAAGRIAANLIPQGAESDPIRKLAAVNAMTIVRMAQSLRLEAMKANTAAAANATTPPAAPTNGKEAPAAA